MHYKNVKLYPKINSYELVTNPDVRYLKNYYIKVWNNTIIYKQF